MSGVETTARGVAAPRKKGGIPYSIAGALSQLAKGTFSDLRLTVCEKAVLGQYVQHADARCGTNPSWPKRTTVAKKVGCSVRTVIRALERLSALGLLVAYEQDRNARNGRFLQAQYGLSPSCCRALRIPLGERISVEPHQSGSPSDFGEDFPVENLPPDDSMSPGTYIKNSFLRKEPINLTKEKQPLADVSRQRNPDFVKTQKGHVPRDLIWMVCDGKLRDTDVCWLMRLASERKQRLSDLVFVKWSAFFKQGLLLTGNALKGMVLHLLKQERDWGWIRRQAEAKKEREEKVRQANERKKTLTDRWNGKWFSKAEGNVRFRVRGHLFELWEAGKTTYSAIGQFDAAFIKKVEEGSYVPMNA